MSFSRRKIVTYEGGGDSKPPGGEGSPALLHPRDKKAKTTRGGCPAPLLARSALCVLSLFSLVLTCHGRPGSSTSRHSDLVQPHSADRWPEHIILPGESPSSQIAAATHLIGKCRVKDRFWGVGQVLRGEEQVLGVSGSFYVFSLR